MYEKDLKQYPHAVLDCLFLQNVFLECSNANYHAISLSGIITASRVHANAIVILLLYNNLPDHDLFLTPSLTLFLFDTCSPTHCSHLHVQQTPVVCVDINNYNINYVTHVHELFFVKVAVIYKCALLNLASSR